MELYYHLCFKVYLRDGEKRKAWKIYSSDYNNFIKNRAIMLNIIASEHFKYALFPTPFILGRFLYAIATK